MFCILVIYVIAKGYLIEQESKIDLYNTTAQDYTVHAYKLHHDLTEEEVKNYFESEGRYDGKPAKVVKVNFPYKIHDYIKNLREFARLTEKLNEFEEKKKNFGIYAEKKICRKAVTEESLNNQLKRIKNEIAKFEENLPANAGNSSLGESENVKKSLLIGQAFVTFETQADAKAVALKHNKQ